MNLDLTKKMLTAISILVGTVVGAGVLGMPYVAARAGFFVVLGYLLIFGGLIMWINLCFGEVLLRTKEEHQLMGIASKYLGQKGKDFMFIIEIINIKNHM